MAEARLVDELTRCALACHAIAVIGDEPHRRGRPACDVERVRSRAADHLTTTQIEGIFAMSCSRFICRVQVAPTLIIERSPPSTGFAEIAARTGFADQSHLSRWVRRVHGVPLSRLTA
jgi:AraC-like DNA-binding protein